jgi:hypothetical protein
MEDARRRLCSTNDASSAVRVSASQLSALKFLAGQHGGSRPVCAVLVSGADPRRPCKLITRDVEELGGDQGDLPRDPGNSITVSIIGSTREDCGPWEILAEVDWRMPHLMVQHLEAGPIIHAFVGASEPPDNWAWRETPVVFSTERAAGDVGFSYLPAEGALPGNRTITTNSLWRRIEPELDRLDLRSESSDEYDG